MHILGLGTLTQHTVVVVLIVVTLANAFWGFSPPLDTTSAETLLMDLLILTGYLYLLRTALSLPLYVFIHFSDREYSNFLSISDRLGIVAVSFSATLPSLHETVTKAGIAGLVLMLVLFILQGSFLGLVDDPLATTRDIQRAIIFKIRLPIGKERHRPQRPDPM